PASRGGLLGRVAKRVPHFAWRFVGSSCQARPAFREVLCGVALSSAARVSRGALWGSAVQRGPASRGGLLGRVAKRVPRFAWRFVARAANRGLSFAWRFVGSRYRGRPAFREVLCRAALSGGA